MPQTPKQNFQYNLKSRYGITPEDYYEMYEEQQGLCGICGEAKSLVVDHDHDTGDVRGLICQNCNLGIGQLKDSLVLLCQSIKYLLNPPFYEKTLGRNVMT